MESWRPILSDCLDTYSQPSRCSTSLFQLCTNYYLRRQASDSYPLKTLDEWTSVFKLAALWDMEDVKAEAIQKMTPLLENQPAKQVKFSLEHDVGEWLIPGLQRLVRREEPLNRNDVDLIGLDYALKVMALREDCRFERSWSIHRRGEVSIDVSAEVRVRFGIRS
jgi:hypothetical protein